MISRRFILIGFCLTAACTTSPPISNATSGRQPNAETSAAPDGAAVFVNSGSTNSPGFTITVATDGNVQLSVLGVNKKYLYSPASTKRFFADLLAAKDSGKVLRLGCIKSASFGSSTKLLWRGWSMEDLECSVTHGDDPLITNLIYTYQKIQSLVRENQVVTDIQRPIRQQPPDLPHCTTPDGHYRIELSAAIDGKNFAEISLISGRGATGSPEAYDFYSASKSSPFQGLGKTGSASESFTLTLTDPEYERETDASLTATFVDQTMQDDGVTPLDPTPILLSYTHISCTRWYR